MFQGLWHQCVFSCLPHGTNGKGTSLPHDSHVLSPSLLGDPSTPESCAPKRLPSEPLHGPVASLKEGILELSSPKLIPSFGISCSPLFLHRVLSISWAPRLCHLNSHSPPNYSWFAIMVQQAELSN